MAIRFNGSTAQLTRTTNLPGITTHTLLAWVYMVTFAGTSTLFGFGAAAVSGSFYSVGPGNNGTNNRVFLYNSTANAYGTTNLSTATWYHLAMTIAGTGAGQQIAYLNGVQEVTATAAAGITANTLFVGNSAGSDPLDGRAAAIKIYGAVLTADEIKQEMRSYLPLRLANLLTWHPMLLAGDTGQYGTAWTSAGTVATEDGPPIPWAIRPAMQTLRLPIVVQRGPARGTLALTTVAGFRASQY